MTLKNYLTGLGIGLSLAGAVAFANSNAKTKTLEEKINYITVKSGDTLTQIAKDYNTTIEQIQKYNPEITDANNIKIGQKIYFNDVKPKSLEEKAKENIDFSKFNFPNPKYTASDNFANDSEQNVISRLYLGEGRGEIENGNDNYVFGVGRSVVNRAKKWNKTSKQVALKNNGKVWSYTCFDPKDSNYEVIKDPLKVNKKNNPDYEKELEMKIKLWNKCYNLAGKTLDKNAVPENETQRKLMNATNYWVDFEEAPYWAYEDNDKDKPLRKPLAVIPVMNGEYKAYFYEFEYP